MSISLASLAKELGVDPNDLQTVAAVELDPGSYDDEHETFTNAGAQAMRAHFRGGNPPENG